MDQQPQSHHSAPAPQHGPKIDFNLDPRAMETLKWSAVWNGVGGAIENIFGYIGFMFVGGMAGDLMRTLGVSVTSGFSVGDLIKGIFWGAVYGAIFGFLISKFYTHIQGWNRKYLKGKLNTFFKLLFYPSLVGSIIGFLMAGSLSFAVGIMPSVILLIGMVLSSFIYAKMMEKKVGGLYPPPV